MKEQDMRTMFFKPSVSLASFFCYLAVAAMLWSPVRSSAQSDVTQPTDTIILVDGVNDGDSAPAPGDPSTPANEGVTNALNNTTSKYLNFLDLGSGFIVQPAIGNTIVTGIRLYTANDSEARDPASYLLEGGNSTSGPWTTISSGGLALPSGRNPGGQALSPALFQQTVSFANSTAYAAYRVTFPTLKNAASANSMQIGEVELLGAQQPASLADFIELGRQRVGSYQYNGASPGGESYTIVGGGNDTWDRWDELAFAYHQLSGDFDIKVQVTEIEASGQWSKAGIMVRENMAEDSKRVMQSVAPCGMTAQGVNGACTREFLWRTGINNVDGENGGNHSTSVGAPNYPNAWIRMVRSGDVFSGYGSDNGVDWTLIATQDSSTWQGGPLPGTVYVGLSVSRHPSAGLPSCRAVFANYAETTSNFGLVADSKGCPDRILISFNRPYGPSALDFQNYALITSDVFPANSVVAVDDKTVAFLIEPMTEGAVYSIQATGNVLDANGNPIDPARSVGTFTHAKGFEKRKIHVQHNRIDGAALGFYLESKAYALGHGAWSHGNPPYETGFLEAGLPVFQDPIDANQGAERFSSRVVGVLSPAADMSAIFAISTDDEGKLFLGSNDQPASKSQIAAEPGWNGNREYATGLNQGSRGVPPANISTPQALVGGNKYYLELIFSEGGGGNWCSATWDAGSGAAIVNGQSPIQEANFVDSRFAHGYLFYNLGAPTITVEPQDATSPVGSPASFSMTLDGTPPYKVTWRRNGAVIAGQSGTTLNIAAVAEADNGATYQATVVNACGEVITRTATLTVLLNPRLTSASSRGNCHAVFINYNKAMQLDGTYSMICSNHADGTITPVTLSNIRHGATTSQIRFDVSPDLLPDTNTYYVTVTGAHAQDGLIIDPDPTTVSFVHGSEYPIWNVLVRQFNDVGNGNINAFLTAPKVVNNQPDVVYRNPTAFFETLSNIRENYGSIISGYYVAPVTGNYQFWTSSDDGGATYLSTDANPASKVQITAEPAWGGIRAWANSGDPGTQAARGTPPIYSSSNPGGNGSQLIPLTAGQVVYLEGNFTEGGGGDNYAATVVIDPVDPNVPPPNGTLPIPVSAFVPRRSAPDGTVFTTLCDVFCNPGPTDKTVFIGQSATFTAAPDGTPPYTLQWKRNGVVIPGATGSSYTTPPATQAQDGDVFTFVVANEFSTNECSAQLIVRDEPLVVRCETRNDPLHVYVTYNKPVQLDGTYTIIDNFDTFPIDVLGVAHGSSQSEVVLTTSGLPPEHSFTLTITGVHDQEAMPVGGNLIVPDPTVCTFGQGPGRFCVDFNDNMIPMGSRSTGTAPPAAEDGVLKLTRNGVTSQQNFWTIDVAPQVLKCFEARWDTLLNGPIGNAADGFSFNVGNNLAFPVAAEEGGNNGLSVTVDTFDNGGSETGIEVRWNGNRLAFTPTGAGNGPAALMRNVFVPANLTVTPSGFVTFNYDTFTVSAQIPSFTGISANQYVFAARTGGAAEDAWIDNVCINDFTLGDITVAIAPVDPSVPECTSVTFTSTVTGSPCHFYQWKRNGVDIPGATGKSYTTPALLLADDGAVYSLTVNNEFSTATASSTIDIVPDNTAPTIVSVGALNSTSVGIAFSEAVEAASATTIGNYSINGGAAGAGISSIRLREDGRSVALTLSTPIAGCAFTVNTTGVLDACPARNSAPSAGAGTVIGLVGVDVGTGTDPGPPGGNSVSTAEDGVEIIARGGDMWGTEDHIQFAHTQISGDFDVQVKVESLECTAQWAKAGLGARATLGANSPAITTYLNPLGPCGANQIESGARPTPGAGMDQWNDAPYNGSGEIYPRPLASDFRWIRLKRQGNRFTAHHSVDGTPGSWIEHADTGDVAGTPLTLFVGLLATPNNGNSGVPTKAVFSNFGLAPSLSIVPSAGNVTISTVDPCAVIEGNISLDGITPWVPLGPSPQLQPAAGPMRYFRAVRP
jgi:hypothetical protein